MSILYTKGKLVLCSIFRFCKHVLTFLILSFLPKIDFTDQNGSQRGINFDYFWIQKWMQLQTSKVEERHKKWGDLSSFHVSFLNMVPKVIRKCLFAVMCCFQHEIWVCCYIAICIYFLFVFTVSGIGYYIIIYCFGNFRVWSWGVLLNFCRVNIAFDILILN